MKVLDLTLINDKRSIFFNWINMRLINVLCHSFVSKWVLILQILVNYVSKFTWNFITMDFSRLCLSCPGPTSCQVSIFALNYFGILPDATTGTTSIKNSWRCGLFAINVVLWWLSLNKLIVKVSLSLSLCICRCLFHIVSDKETVSNIRYLISLLTKESAKTCSVILNIVFLIFFYLGRVCTSSYIFLLQIQFSCCKLNWVFIVSHWVRMLCSLVFWQYHERGVFVTEWLKLIVDDL